MSDEISEELDAIIRSENRVAEIEHANAVDAAYIDGWQKAMMYVREHGHPDFESGDEPSVRQRLQALKFALTVEERQALVDEKGLRKSLKDRLGSEVDIYEEFVSQINAAKHILKKSLELGG